MPTPSVPLVAQPGTSPKEEQPIPEFLQIFHIWTRTTPRRKTTRHTTCRNVLCGNQSSPTQCAHFLAGIQTLDRKHVKQQKPKETKRKEEEKQHRPKEREEKQHHPKE